MFDYFKKRAYANEVETQMAYLLGFRGENFIKQAYVAYPNLKATIRENMKDGVSTLHVASEMLRIVFTAEIEKMSAAKREELKAHLTTDNSSQPPSLFANLCRMYCTQMYFQHDRKTLDANWCNDCTNDIAWATLGMTYDERANRRLTDAIVPKWSVGWIGLQPRLLLGALGPLSLSIAACLSGSISS